jgi:hypothetical protein
VLYTGCSAAFDEARICAIPAICKPGSIETIYANLIEHCPEARPVAVSH